MLLDLHGLTLPDADVCRWFRSTCTHQHVASCSQIRLSSRMLIQAHVYVYTNTHTHVTSHIDTPPGFIFRKPTYSLMCQHTYVVMCILTYYFIPHRSVLHRHQSTCRRLCALILFVSLNPKPVTEEFLSLYVYIHIYIYI